MMGLLPLTHARYPVWAPIARHDALTLVAVGSFAARAWRAFDFRSTGRPPIWMETLPAVVAYLNVSMHHFVADVRAGPFVASCVVFGRCAIHYRIWRTHRRMPPLIGLVLVTVFIWLAENLGTYARAWAYPFQVRVWAPVGLGKFGSWYLLMIVSYVFVLWVNGVQAPRLFTRAARGATARVA